MRIKEIRVTNLFGMFNHTIKLNLDERITVVYGINGIGKTMLFRLVYNYFTLTTGQWRYLPFEKLEITFENNFIEKIYKDNKNYTIDIFNENNIKQAVKDYKTFNYIAEEYHKKGLKITNEHLSIFHDPVKVYFIKTQRLFTPKVVEVLIENKGDKTTPFNTVYDSILKETVEIYSKELANLIQEKHSEYSKLSEKLEQTLGKRLMNKEVKTISDINELRNENEKLENRRKELNSVGLFESKNEEELIIPDDIDDLSKAVLSVNIQDMKSKLKIFDELYERLKIFLDILNNKRFSYKQIFIHPEEGFVFKNSNEKELKATDLSSGEQNEIVMFYDLLFKIEENSLVLIDEPEISLHVAWQKEFLNDMSEIVKLRNFDILIATHSPQIINGNWNLTVELEKQ